MVITSGELGVDMTYMLRNFAEGTVGYATTNECYNGRMLQRTNATTNYVSTNECYNERLLQRTMLQRTNATTNYVTTNECYNEQFLSTKS
jgi:hypothetical protein